ncbi:MAG: YifB family Mg chelatase-like AAA ATPase, partial [Bacteroidota bacterium]
ILAADENMDATEISQYIIMGELSFDGSLRPLKGILPMAIMARKKGFKGIVIPKANASEAAIVNQLEVIPVVHLSEAVAFFKGTQTIKPLKRNTRLIFQGNQEIYPTDFIDIKGYENEKRALEVAAAGGHNTILVGPPGSGKTMLAQRFSSILPPLSLDEALQTTKIHSVAGKLHSNSSLIAHRPFRAIHHSSSDIKLVVGDSNSIGEPSLAHNGVLFLEELPEFKSAGLQLLYQSFINRQTSISTEGTLVTYPAHFFLLASSNPCICGYSTHPFRKNECNCSSESIQKYFASIPDTFMDAFDIHVEVRPMLLEDVSLLESGETSASIRERVVMARARQIVRFTEYPDIKSNSMIPKDIVRDICKVDKQGLMLLKIAMRKLNLSVHAFNHILKVARTIADLCNKENILPEHVAEAIQYRSLDRENWGA